MRGGQRWVWTFDGLAWAARLAVVVVDTWAVIAVWRAGREHWAEISPFLGDIIGVLVVAVFANVTLLRFVRWWRS